MGIEWLPSVWLFMIERDPNAFLSSLYEALDRRLQPNPDLHPAGLSFYAAKYAVALRMKAIDDIADKFEDFLNLPNRAAELVDRLPTENQLLFDFFANGLSALESFCFGCYYVGVGLDNSKFDIKRSSGSIKPGKVQVCFQAFAPADGFTLALSASLGSREFAIINAMRNTLLHRFAPGRAIRVLRPDAPHIIKLDQRHNGEPLQFFLDPKALVKERNWIDEQLELLSSSLLDLASKQGIQ
jgi:hypothetical protein